jgi:hypothetical protein
MSPSGLPSLLGEQAWVDPPKTDGRTAHRSIPALNARFSERLVKALH